jgi:uncharacterized RDD family membrane protein YckC
MIADQLSRRCRTLPIRGEVNAFAQSSPAPAGPQLDNRRVLAAIVDLVVIFVGSFAIGTIVGLVNGGSADWTGRMQLITVAWALYYYFAFESGDGQTLGKKLLKIRVLRADGTPAGMRDIAVRTVLRVIDGLFMYLVGLIVMLATGQRRQRLGDLAAGTVVADASATAAPQASPAAFAPPAAGTAADLDDPELPADAEPREKTPADIGEPLEGLTPPQPAATPELSDFQPFSPQADDTEDSEEPIEEPAAEETPAFDAPAEETPSFATPAAQETPSFEAPAAEGTSLETPADEPSFDTPADPQPEPLLSDEPSPAAEAGRTEWPHMYAERASRAYEAEVELSPQPQEPHVDDAPAVADEDAPAAEQEITLKPIETVSAIDLVMGDQAAQGDSSPAEPSDEAAGSGDQPGSSDEPDSGDDRSPGL